MSDQTDILSRTLAAFGLSPEETRIYLHLLAKGSLSALQISRDIHLSRTKVYRLLDKLGAKGLVAQRFDSLGLKFKATPYTQLELLLVEKENEAKSLRESLPLVYKQISQLVGSNETGSKVFYHHGIDGLKHVTWNSLNANDTLRIYEKYDSMNVFLDKEFSEVVRREFAHRKVIIHQLTGLTHIEPYTDVSELIPFWEVRYVNPKLFAMKFEVVIYNDVYSMYQYGTGEEFCVEIHNPELASMQKQLFDYVWQTATPMKKIGKHGEAKIERS